MTFPRTQSIADPTTAPEPAHMSGELAGDELVSQLARLAELRRSESLTEDEFRVAKCRVLDLPVPRLIAPRVTLRMPSRRMVPEIHPVDAFTSASLALLDQAAKRLGGTCRPISEQPVQVPLDGDAQAKSDLPDPASEQGPDFPEIR